jgi:hypothetical protein
MGFFQRGDGGHVHAGVVANGGVGAAASLDADDAIGGKGVVADKEFGVFAGVDVIGYDGHGNGVAKPLTEAEDKHGFAGAHGAADT